MLSRCLAILAVLACGALARAQNSDPVFDVPALAGTPLNAKVLKGPVEKDGVMVEEVMFHSEMDGEKSVDIFAIFAYPKGAKALPAFVWNQGGLGQATEYFPILGAKRGYAALCIDFPLPKYRSTGNYNIVSGLNVGDNPKQAPIYHGAVALIKAVSYLESRPEVDKGRIGMCGSSWGGFYTTLMVGVDLRLKVGSAMFGCGYMNTGNNWWGAPGDPRFPKAAVVTHWMETLDPGPRLKKIKTPIGWFTGTNDMFYWMPALMQTYDAAGGPKHLSLFPNWAHGLPTEGDEAVFAFLDAYLQGKPALMAVTPIKIEKGDGRVLASWNWTVPAGRRAVSGDMILSYGDAGNWLSRYWKTDRSWSMLPKVDGPTGGRQLIYLPASPIPYYISVSFTDANGTRTSTPLVRVDVAKLGLLDAKAKLDYNGCAMWGGFEPGHVDWLARHAFMQGLKVSPDAKEGTQSAKFGPGKHRLYPIYFTAGLPHRLAFYAKAENPVEVTLNFNGQGLDKAKVGETKVNVGTEWTLISVDLTTPDRANATLEALLTVPEGAGVLVDDVSFRPIEAGMR